MRTISQDAELVTTLAAVIREVDGSHSLGAAELAEALVERGVRISDPDRCVYAVATVCRDGTIEPVSNSFGTEAEAQQDLAVLCGDDYYRDREPFIASSSAQVWQRVAD